MFFDGRDDSSMRGDGRCSTLIRLQRFFAAAAEHFHQPENQFLQRLILRGTADTQVQFRVSVDARLAPVYRLFLFGDNLFQLRDISLCCALGSRSWPQNCDFASWARATSRPVQAAIA